MTDDVNPEAIGHAKNQHRNTTSEAVIDKARMMYLSGETFSCKEISERVGVMYRTVLGWKEREGWDKTRQKIELQAGIQLVEKLANERTTLNLRHFDAWSEVIHRALAMLHQLDDAPEGADLEFWQAKQNAADAQVKALEKISRIIDMVQKGQRLARGLNADGRTEEQVYAEAERDTRNVIDAFYQVIDVCVTDQKIRDNIAKELNKRCKTEYGIIAEVIEEEIKELPT